MRAGRLSSSTHAPSWGEHAPGGAAAAVDHDMLSENDRMSVALGGPVTPGRVERFDP
jgi:hypothetical protein